ncbi:ABC transporter permease [Oceanobacillus profundus]|uniref:ABC transporter permease n=1 Tax=Oceanobacillus profundus TaxID=372463 RepID=UPI00203FEA09|nr:ABC transporter permease [Oceanobacillus profundus]MCM3399533.1 ABC transporter permease [Oceanobacillus profundus]
MEERIKDVEEQIEIKQEAIIPPEKEGRKWSPKTIVDKFGALFGLIGLSIIMTILAPTFMSVDNLMNVARQASINALLSLGMLLPIITAGIDLSVGSILALSIVMGGLVTVTWGMSPIIGLIALLVIGALAGLINGLLLTKLRLPHPFISTLGTMNVYRGLALIITGASPIFGFPLLMNYVGQESISIVPVSFILVIVVAIIMHIFLNRTATGRYIYAIGGNKEAARLSGIPVDRVLIIVYTVSGFMAALGGLVLIGRTNSASPIAGLTYELDAIAAVIIGGASFFGGVGTVIGTLIGALIIAVLRNGLNLIGTSSDLQTVVIGVVIILAVFVDVLRRKGAKK